MSIPAQWASLGLTVNAADLPQALNAALYQRWHKELAGQTTAPLALTFRAGTLPACPVEPQAVQVSGTTTQVGTCGQELWLGRGLYLQLEQSTLVARVDPRQVQEIDLLLAFAEAHRLAGWLPLHACTVMGPHTQRAISLSGVSGAGKSTAALRLMQAGYQVLAEDQTWLCPGSGLVTGLDRHLRAYPDSISRFAPQLLARSQGQDSHGKELLPLNSAASGQLAALGFLGLEAQPGAAQRVRAVWECTGVPLLNLSQQRSAQAVQTLLTGVPISGLDRDKVLEMAAAWLGPA